MRRSALAILAFATIAPSLAAQGTLQGLKPGRDPNQRIDSAYTAKIHEYTTQPFFTSPLVDYLPASKTVPTPMAVLGDIAGAKENLPYSTQVYDYMRRLAAASPRVRVWSIGHTEEGREMIAVGVASESLWKNLDANRANLAKLADPRTIGMNDAEAAKLIANTTPVYYITGTIHSPESGAPTALMELAYRLAVDESPYVKNIRDHLITLITPIVEVDGRDREVDIQRWHLAHPKDTPLPLIYWGHYVAHDNNRDAMGAHARPHAERAQHLCGLERAGAARSARIGALPVRQHGGRRPVQRVGRSAAHQRVANARLEQRAGDDALRHARRVRPRRLRHLVARLPHVHRRHAQRHQPPVRDVRQWRHRRDRRCARSIRARPRRRGSGRIRRCRVCSGRCATTTTTSRRDCWSRCSISRTTGNYSSRISTPRPSGR